MKTTLYGLKGFRPEIRGIIRDVRALWLLEELGLPYDYVLLDTQKGENKSEAYLKINPLGKVPTVVDGDFTLFESGAVCEYLAEKNGRFIPAHGTPDYYKCKQWMFFALTNIEPQGARIFACDFFMEKNATTAEMRQLAVEVLGRFLGGIDAALAKSEFLVGG